MSCYWCNGTGYQGASWQPCRCCPAGRKIMLERRAKAQATKPPPKPEEPRLVGFMRGTQRWDGGAKPQTVGELLASLEDARVVLRVPDPPPPPKLAEQPLPVPPAVRLFRVLAALVAAYIAVARSLGRLFTPVEKAMRGVDWGFAAWMVVLVSIVGVSFLWSFHGYQQTREARLRSEAFSRKLKLESCVSQRQDAQDWNADTRRYRKMGEKAEMLPVPDCSRFR